LTKASGPGVLFADLSAAQPIANVADVFSPELPDLQRASAARARQQHRLAGAAASTPSGGVTASPSQPESPVSELEAGLSRAQGRGRFGGPCPELSVGSVSFTHMSSAYDRAAELAAKAEQGFLENQVDLRPDQALALAQVWANLSVSQELSRMIMDEGLSVRIDERKPSQQIGESEKPKRGVTALKA
jgi:hypothetical protein